MYGQNLKQYIVLVLKVSVHYACGHARALCYLSGVGAVIAYLRKQLVARVYDFILFSMARSCWGVRTS